jgi:hypothetical protein
LLPRIKRQRGQPKPFVLASLALTPLEQFLTPVNSASDSRQRKLRAKNYFVIYLIELNIFPLTHDILFVIFTDKAVVFEVRSWTAGRLLRGATSAAQQELIHS